LLEKKYVDLMSLHRFNEVESFSHHHYSSKSNKGTTVSRATIKRLASEYSDLSVSLPITADSSILVRVHEKDLTMAQMLIMPGEHTPYAFGCFLFDISFPHSYPNVPPQVNLQTTGNGAVRFNPNLYQCGKVCLSLLGTWNGDNAWSQASTLLQVAISLQSLVFVAQPYFNEPGYERNMGTPSATESSKNYTRNIRQQTVRHAIIGMMRNSPKPFQEAIRIHFSLLKDRIYKLASTWASEDTANQSWISLLAELKKEFDNLPTFPSLVTI